MWAAGLNLPPPSVAMPIALMEVFDSPPVVPLLLFIAFEALNIALLASGDHMPNRPNIKIWTKCAAVQA